MTLRVWLPARPPHQTRYCGGFRHIRIRYYPVRRSGKTTYTKCKGIQEREKRGLQKKGGCFKMFATASVSISELLIIFLRRISQQPVSQQRQPVQQQRRQEQLRRQERRQFPPVSIRG